MNRKIWNCIIPTILVFASIQISSAQLPFEIGLHTDYGFIFRHAPKVGHLQSHPWAVTAYFNRYHLG
ncbi:MAG: hypothetical protein RML72_00440, partial [Bacteroidia bacterium]|nr:hypothetical protein [Bacteroidia bacterium]